MKAYAFYKNETLECVFLRKFTAIRALITEKDRVRSEGNDIETSIYSDYIGCSICGSYDTFVKIEETTYVKYTDIKTYEVEIRTHWGSVIVSINLPIGTDERDVIKEAELVYKKSLEFATSFIIREYPNTLLL